MNILKMTKNVNSAVQQVMETARKVHLKNIATGTEIINVSGAAAQDMETAPKAQAVNTKNNIYLTFFPDYHDIIRKYHELSFKFN